MLRLAPWIGIVAVMSAVAILSSAQGLLAEQPTPQPVIRVDDICGGGNFTNGLVDAAMTTQFDILAAAGAHAIRMNVYGVDYYDTDGQPTPNKLDAQVLQAHQNGVRTILLLLEYYDKVGQQPGPGNELGDQNKWQAIGKAFAERFAPNSAFFTSQGIHDWGITIYEAMNEPNIDRQIPFTGPSSYYSTLEGLADGVHSVSPGLAVIPAGLATKGAGGDRTLNGYGKAIAPLLNEGKLDGLDLHIYSDIKFAPIVKEDGQVTYKCTAQAEFDEIKKACGITRDINFYCSEYNFKSGEQGIDDNLAAKRLLTCIWDRLGVVKSDGRTPATKLALVWNLFHTTEKDKRYGMTVQTAPWAPAVRAKTYQLVMTLAAGMTFTHLDPLDRGEFALAGDGRTLWIWQNYEGFSSIHGTRYTISAIPASAKTVKVYGWDGLRKTIELHGQSFLTVEDLNERETYMFLAAP